MANDPALGVFTLVPLAPSLTFPLSGSKQTVGVKIAPTIASTAKNIAAFTRTWAASDPTKVLHNESDEQSLFPPWNRPVSVRVIVPPILVVAVHHVTNRQWNGIGGIGYLPSFPQLDRKNTTWPHAS